MASTHRADVCSVAQGGQNNACGVLETLLLHRCRNGTRPGIGERSKVCTPDRGIVSGLRLQRTVVTSEVVQGVLQGAGKVADRTAARSIRRLHWTRRRREDDVRRIMAWLASSGIVNRRTSICRCWQCNCLSFICHPNEKEREGFAKSGQQIGLCGQETASQGLTEKC